MTPYPAAFVPILEQLRAEGRRYFGADDVVFEPVRYSERRGSFLLQISILAGQEKRGAFVKIYKSGNAGNEASERLRQRVNRDYSITHSVHEALAGDERLSAVFPIAVFPEHCSIVTLQAPGRELGMLIEANARWRRTSGGLDAVVGAVRDTGRWLSRFQGAISGDSVPLCLDSTLSYVDVRLQKLLNAEAITETDRRSVRAAIERLWPAIPTDHLRRVPIHADYCLGNVLVHGQRIVVLDFAMTRTGAVYHDLAHMYLQLQLLESKPWFRPPVVRFLCDALLEGYAPGTRSDAPLFQVLMIHHVVNHLTKLTIRAPRRQISRPYNWLVRRRHMAWLRRNGCLAGRQAA